MSTEAKTNANLTDDGKGYGPNDPVVSAQDAQSGKVVVPDAGYDTGDGVAPEPHPDGKVIFEGDPQIKPGDTEPTPMRDTYASGHIALADEPHTLSAQVIADTQDRQNRINAGMVDPTTDAEKAAKKAYDADAKAKADAAAKVVVVP